MSDSAGFSDTGFRFFLNRRKWRWDKHLWRGLSGALASICPDGPVRAGTLPRRLGMHVLSVSLASLIRSIEPRKQTLTVAALLLPTRLRAVPPASHPRPPNTYLGPDRGKTTVPRFEWVTRRGLVRATLAGRESPTRAHAAQSALMHLRATVDTMRAEASRPRSLRGGVPTGVSTGRVRR